MAETMPEREGRTVRTVSYYTSIETARPPMKATPAKATPVKTTPPRQTPVKPTRS